MLVRTADLDFAGRTFEDVNDFELPVKWKGITDALARTRRGAL